MVERVESMEKFLNQTGLRKTVEGIKEYIDASELDFTNPIMVDAPWQILYNIVDRLGYGSDFTLKMNLKAGSKYVIKGSRDYPVVTASNRLFTPALRNTMGIAEFTSDFIDPMLPQSPHHYHMDRPILHTRWITGPFVKIVTWGCDFPEFLIWDSGSVESLSDVIPEWIVSTRWVPTRSVQGGNFSDFFLRHERIYPVIVRGKGHSIVNMVSSSGEPRPTLPYTSSAFDIPSVQGLSHGIRFTNLGTSNTQTDFNLMILPGSYSITSASVLAHAPPETMQGNLRRVCHVTVTAGGGRIQELEMFSDAPDTPFVTWKRARRTSSQDSWTPWKRMVTEPL